MRYLILLALVLIPAAAHAQTPDVPLFSAERLQLGAGLNYEWLAVTDGATADPAFPKEFTAGLYGSYNIYTPLDFIGFSKYGLDSRRINSALGLRLTFFSGAK